MKSTIYGPITPASSERTFRLCITSTLEEVRTRAGVRAAPDDHHDDLAIYAAQADHRAPALRGWVRDSCELARFIHNG